MRVPVLAVGTMLCLFAAAGPGQAQETRNAPTPSSGQAKPQPPKQDRPQTAEPPAAPAAVREAYVALPLSERFSIQSDLIWSGDYNGGITGEFGDRAIAAVKSFQKRNKFKETGILTPAERATLAEAVREKQEQIGWTLVEDPVMTGVRLGIPEKLAPRKQRGITGGRWSSSRGEVHIETFRDSIADTTFAALFEQHKKGPKSRKTEYSVLRPDFFVVSGLQGLKKFYIRAQLKDSEVRGIGIFYDQAMEGIMEPVVIAMSSAFAPFSSEQALIGIKRNVEYASALVATQSGHLLADRIATDGCHVILVPGKGHAERIAEDRAADIVLLRLYGDHKLTPLAFSASPPRGSDLTLVGIPDPKIQNGGSTADTAKVRIRGIEGGRVVLDPAPPPGFSGAAAIDDQGQFVGLAVLKPAIVAGPAAAPQAALASAAAIIAFLEANKATPSVGPTNVAAAKASMTRIVCIRK